SHRSSREAAFGEPVNLGALINTEHGDSKCTLSGDGTIMIWESNRDGGRGDLDLWMSRRALPVGTAPGTGQPPPLAEILTAPDYTWSEPENLGSTVNTAGRELSPCLT